MSRAAEPIALPDLAPPGVDLHVLLAGYRLGETEVRTLTVLLDLRPIRDGAESIVKQLRQKTLGTSEHQGSYPNVETAIDALSHMAGKATQAAIHLLLVLPEYSVTHDADVSTLFDALADLRDHEVAPPLAIAQDTAPWSRARGLKHFVRPSVPGLLTESASELFHLVASLGAPTAFLEIEFDGLLACSGSAEAPGCAGSAWLEPQGFSAIYLQDLDAACEAVKAVACPRWASPTFADVKAFRSFWASSFVGATVPDLSVTSGFWRASPHLDPIRVSILCRPADPQLSTPIEPA